MSQEYWQKQGSEPLFPNLLWSRPETRQGAGKLLIIGGQAQEFSNVADCYSAAEQAGAGTIRVLMPDSTRKATGHLPNIEYAASNQSGSFSTAALSAMLEASQWADGVLLAGDLGKNSETTLTLERLIIKFQGLLTVSGEALSNLALPATNLLRRSDTLFMLNIPQLQKAAIRLELQKPVTSDMSNSDLAEVLHQITRQASSTLIVKAGSQIWISSNGKVVSSRRRDIAPTVLISNASVWAIQNPTKIFEAATTSLYT